MHRRKRYQPISGYSVYASQKAISITIKIFGLYIAENDINHYQIIRFIPLLVAVETRVDDSLVN